MRKLCASLILVIAALGFVTAGSADNRADDDDRWRAEKARYDLQDREKLLLSKEDDLNYRIQGLKQKIKALNTELSGAQADMDAVRHELIVLKIKLLP
jgi:chromosome segregation ATPase